MPNCKVIDLSPGVADPREHLGTLCFEEVVPIDTVPRSEFYTYDRKSTRVKGYSLHLGNQCVRASKFTKIEHVLGEYVPCKPEHLPIVVRKMQNSEYCTDRPKLEFENLLEGSSLRVKVFIVNAHLKSHPNTWFIDFMNEWRLMMTGVARDGKRVMHANVVTEYDRVVDALSNDFKAKMAAASMDDYAIFKEQVRQKGVALVPFKHQYVAVKAMLDMEEPPEGQSLKAAVSTRVADKLWYDMSSGQFVDDSFRGGMCNLSVGLGKSFLIALLAFMNDDVVPADLFFGGTVVVVPKHLCGQWAKELIRYKPRTVVTANYLDPGPADFLIVDRKNLDGLAGRKVHRLVFDEAHTLQKRHIDHGIVAQYRWAVTATPKRDASNIVTSFRMQLPALGLPEINLKGCNVVDGLLTAKMRKLVVNVDQSVAADLFPKVVESRVHVPRSAYDVDAQYRFAALKTRYPIVTANSWTVQNWETRQGSYNFQDLIDQAEAAAQNAPVRAGPRILPPLASMTVVQADDIDDCPVCFELCDPCVQTPCGHRYCHDCLSTCLTKNAACPYCRQRIRIDKVVAVRNDAATTSAAQHASEPEPEPEDDKMFVFSSRIDKAIELVVENARKTIVFVDNQPALNLTRSKLTAAGIKSVIVPAKASLIQNRVDRFVNDPAYKCIVLNMKKFADGLNLVVADQIVFVNSDVNDPKFHAIKTQAIGRINRIGQVAKEVKVVTLV
jgi:Zinc finger, C3HC4 type (RING finger)